MAMRIRNAVNEVVWVDGRGKVRLLDAMAEAGVPYQEVGFPVRWYHRPGGVTVIVSRSGRPAERIDLTVRHVVPDGAEISSRVEARKPIPYVQVRGELYQHPQGQLVTWSEKCRAQRGAVLPRGEVILQVLGRAASPALLRVQLPHQGREWLIDERYCRWMDREPTPLDRTIQELWLMNLYHDDPHHPLALAGYLGEYARTERWFLSSDDVPVSVLAVEEWEQLRQDEGLTAHEALVAVQAGLLSMLEDRGTTYHGGLLGSELLERYRKGDWSHRDSRDLLSQMTDLHTIEREMLRACMRAVAARRQLYTRLAFGRMGTG